MKKILPFTFILCLGLGHLVFAQVVDLHKNYSFSSDNISFKNLVGKVQQGGNIFFVYPSDILPMDYKILLPKGSHTLGSILQYLKNNHRIDFLIQGNTVVLKRMASENTILLETPVTLNGRVYDQESGETLIAANVFIKELGQGTMTNNYGFYSITVPKGNYTVVTSYIGYVPMEEHIQLSEVLSHNVALTEQTMELTEVIIDSKKTSNLMLMDLESVKISEQRTRMIPTLMGEPDPLAAMNNLPGVTNVGDGVTGFFVRGGEADQNLILVDGAPLFRSSHLMGLFSVLNGDAIKHVNFYKDIPARFGGKVSSVLEVYQREGNQQFSGKVGVSPFLFKATIEGSLKKDRSTFLLSGRMFNPLMSKLAARITQEDVNLGFFDVQGKVNYKLSDRDKLFLSIYHGRDVVNLGLDNNYSDQLKWGNTLMSMRWNRVISPRLFSNVTAVVSNYHYDYGSVQQSDAQVASGRIFNSRLIGDFSYNISADHQLSFGIFLSHLKINPNFESQPLINYYQDDQNPFSEKVLETAGHLSYESQLGNHWLLNIGLRYSWYGQFGPTTLRTYASGLPIDRMNRTGVVSYSTGELVHQYQGLDPRIMIAYKFNKKWVLKSNFQITRQYVHFLNNSVTILPVNFWKASDANLPPARSMATSLGLYFEDQSKNVNAVLEGYYRKLIDFVEYKNGADLLYNQNIQEELFAAQGRAYGVEFSLAKKFKKMEVDFSYTYSRSLRTVIGKHIRDYINNGQEYSSNFDQPHILTASLIKKLSKTIDVNILFNYKTGRPFSVPKYFYQAQFLNEDLTNENTALVYYYDMRNQNRFPNYHRLDVSFEWHPAPRKRIASTLRWGVYNVYNRKNFSALSYYIHQGELRARAFYIIGTPVPFVSYSLQF